MFTLLGWIKKMLSCRKYSIDNFQTLLPSMLVRNWGFLPLQMRLTISMKYAIVIIP